MGSGTPFWGSPTVNPPTVGVTEGELEQRGCPHPQSIVVKQLNIQHSKMSQMHINNWIDWQKEDRYICLVQEPYIYKEATCNQPKTATKYAGGEGNSPRTAIYL